MGDWGMMMLMNVSVLPSVPTCFFPYIDQRIVDRILPLGSMKEEVDLKMRVWQTKRRLTASLPRRHWVQWMMMVSLSFFLFFGWCPKRREEREMPTLSSQSARGLTPACSVPATPYTQVGKPSQARNPPWPNPAVRLGWIAQHPIQV